MGILTGLKGFKDNRDIGCKFITEPNDIIEILGAGLGATTAGSKGAMNIYNDDYGNVRCELMKFCIVIEEKKFKSIDKAVKWVAKWLPLIQ